jgi:signal transduction histidine kinase
MGEHNESLDQGARAVLRDDSDRLLQAVDELRALEREKRLQDVSSRPFHDLARQVEEKAREVFRLAEQQESHGSIAAHDDPIEDTDPGG